MNRYIKSLAITFTLYVIIFIGFLYAFESNPTLQSQQTKSEQSVKFTIIQERVEKQEKKQEAKKIVKKEIQKKTPKETKKTIVKKEEKQAKKTAEKITKKELVKKPQQTAINQIKKNNSQTDTKNKLSNQEHSKKLELQKQQYYTQIKQLINKNKYYPRIAVKRGIQGVVKINFTISKNGELISCKIMDGKKVFKKSILEAIQSSFPLPPPKGVLTSNTNLSLQIDYRLY